MRNLILCFLLTISACNPLTKAANSEVELLQEKQQLDRAITTWYSKQVDECIVSSKVYMGTASIKDKPITEKVNLVKDFTDKCIIVKEQKALKAAEIIDSINEEDKAAHVVLLDILNNKRDKHELMLMPGKILPLIIQLKEIIKNLDSN